MRRHVTFVAGLWFVLTAIFLGLAQFELLPAAASDKGRDIAHAFRFLLLMAVPVFAFVVAVLVYSVLVFRRRGTPPVDGSDGGARLHGRGTFPAIWFTVTSLLTLVVMVYPGLIELPRLAAVEQKTDITVQVQAFQWNWRLTYPDLGVTTSEALVLPVDKTVRFDITSLDVVHAFWVPAFSMKIDAVPGLTTQMSLRTTSEGDYATDQLFRLQCSQLCGGSHALMKLPVRVVGQTAFDEWVTRNSTKPASSAAADATQLKLTSSGGTLKFDKTKLEAPANKPLAITYDNQDKGIPHNLAVYEAGGNLVGERTAIEQGPVVQVLALPAQPAGTYTFKCDVHPTTMVGTLEIK